MNPTEHGDPVLDPDLMQYLDGTLPPEKLAEVEARLARDPDAREAVAQARHFENLIRDVGRSADELPDSLQIAALERQLVSKLRKRQRRAFLWGPGLRQIAASVVIFAAGWGTHAALYTGGPWSTPSYPAYVTSTLSGHYAYQHAASQRAEFGGDQMAEAVAWLSDQMQRRIDSPQLEQLGYQVESARLVMVEDQPMAVFYYRDAEDRRVTVSMAPRDVMQPDQAPRIAQVQGERVAYWSSDSLHYTVVANADIGSFTTLAAAIQE